MIALLVVCAILTGCGAPNNALQPMQAPAPWAPMMAVEIFGFMPIQSLDWNETSEILLVGVMEDATGKYLICSDANAYTPNENQPLQYSPLSIQPNQTVGLGCKATGRVRDDGQVTLTFVAFEVDDWSRVKDVINFVIVVLDAISTVEKRAKLGSFILEAINEGLDRSGILVQTKAIAALHRTVGQGLDYTQEGDEDPQHLFRLFYQTSPLLDPNASGTTNQIPSPTIPKENWQGIRNNLFPADFYVCQRNEGKRSCKRGGGLNLRSAPCLVNNKSIQKGGNIVTTVPNGTHIHRLRDEIVPSNCPNGQDDGVIGWVYVQTEQGQEGYMSVSPRYHILDLDEQQPLVIPNTSSHA